MPQMTKDELGNVAWVAVEDDAAPPETPGTMSHVYGLPTGDDLGLYAVNAGVFASDIDVNLSRGFAEGDLLTGAPGVVFTIVAGVVGCGTFVRGAGRVNLADDLLRGGRLLNRVAECVDVRLLLADGRVEIRLVDGNGGFVVVVVVGAHVIVVVGALVAGVQIGTAQCCGVVPMELL